MIILIEQFKIAYFYYYEPDVPYNDSEKWLYHIEDNLYYDYVNGNYYSFEEYVGVIRITDYSVIKVKWLDKNWRIERRW